MSDDGDTESWDEDWDDWPEDDEVWGDTEEAAWASIAGQVDAWLPQRSREPARPPRPHAVVRLPYLDGPLVGKAGAAVFLTDEPLVRRWHEPQEAIGADGDNYARFVYAWSPSEAGYRVWTSWPITGPSGPPHPIAPQVKVIRPDLRPGRHEVPLPVV